MLVKEETHIAHVDSILLGQDDLWGFRSDVQLGLVLLPGLSVQTLERNDTKWNISIYNSLLQDDYPR